MKNICNICGANYEYKNGKWVCPACGAYKEEELSNEEVTLLYTASQKLRLNAFDDAEEAYRDIVRKYPENSEGYWGLLLAKYGIKYEQDYDGKMIPTCYATSYESVKDDKNYKRALDLATPENRKYYIEQAEKIEKIRKEWLEKASKEPRYDIFISYKASELEDGVENTNDSDEVYNLYTHLTSLGYRVFFSRESLRGKEGEKYEPYIFNALDTAQIMIVYGSKIDYIEANWIKNEWSRFYKRIKMGKKQPNSLVVVYHGFNPSKLPRPLSSVQSITTEGVDFLQDLEAYIARVLKAANTIVPHIERKEIRNRTVNKTASVAKLEVVEVTQIKGASANAIKRETTPKRKIGVYSVPKLTANAEKLLKIAYAYLDSGNFSEAEKAFDNFLVSNRQNGNALLGKLLAQTKSKNIDEFCKIGVINFCDLQLLNDMLAISEKPVAEKILTAICNEVKRLFAEKEYQEAKKLYEQICSVDNSDVQNICEYLYINSLQKINESADIKYFVDSALLYEQDEDIYARRMHDVFDVCIKLKVFSLAKEYHNHLLECDGISLRTQIGQLQLKYKATNRDEVYAYCEKHNAYSAIENVLEKVDESGANYLLLDLGKRCMGCMRAENYDSAIAWYNIFSKYQFQDRELLLRDIADFCNKISYGDLFEKVATVRSQGDGEKYADFCFEFAENARANSLFSLAISYYEKAIKYGQDSLSCSIGKLYAELKYDSDKKIRDCILNLSDTETLETILALYENDEKRISFLDWLITASLDCVKEKLSVQDRIFTIFETLLSFIPQQYNDKLNLYVNEMAQNCMIIGVFEYAERYYAMSIGLNADDHTAYWGLLLAKLKCKSDEQLIKQKEVITEFQEFQNALLASASNSSAMAHYIDVQNRQKAWVEEQEIKQVKEQKRKRRIKIVSVVLSLLILLCGIITGGVYWYKSENQLKFEKVEGGYAVDSGLFYHNTANGVFEIPSTYNGEPVVRINSGAFKNFDKVTEFIIPESIQTINDKAFADCDGITEIYIPNTVTYIGENVFNNCDNLRIITIETDNVGVPSNWNIDWNNYCSAQVEFSLSVQFSSNGGTISQTAQYVIYDKSFSMPVPVKAGYTFDGWYRDDTKLTNSNGESINTWKSTTGGTVTAKWTANENIIIFNGNGATSGSMSEQKIFTDDFVRLTPNAFERIGYTFAGWSTSASGSVVYYDKSNYKMGTNSSYTIYAVWRANSDTPYLVNHYLQNADDDSYTLCNTEQLTGTTDSVVLPDTHSYVGFDSPTSKEVTIIADGSQIVNYYYTRKIFTITFIDGASTYYRTKRYQATLENWYVTRTDFTFGGWFKEEELINEFYETIMPAEDITLYVWWKEENKPSDFQFDYYDYRGIDCIRILAYNGKESKVCIPSYIGSRPVTVIWGEAFKESTITHVIIPNTILEIEKYAFRDCKQLISAELKNTSNWVASWYVGLKLKDRKYFSSEELLDAVTAAKYLRLTYFCYGWVRETNV